MDDIKSIYSKVINEHRDWLSRFDKRYLKKWEKLLRTQSEAAICEASTRKLLHDNEIEVKPNEDISSGGVDYLCTKCGKHFYVETTCITKEASTRATTLSDEEVSKAESFKPLTKRIFYEMSNKVSQCANLDLACLLVIGTLHYRVGLTCISQDLVEQVLTGSPCIATEIDTQTGQILREPYDATELKDSGFIRPDKSDTNLIEEARKTISALLLCSFSEKPQRALGLIHPYPNYSFDRNLLPNIEFCRLAAGYQTGRFSVEWI